MPFDNHELCHKNKKQIDINLHDIVSNEKVFLYIWSSSVIWSSSKAK